MAEENSSSIGTLIGVAVIAGLIGYFIGKPNPTQEEVNNSPSDRNSSSKLEKTPTVNIPMGDGLVAYFPFNGNAEDASGQGHETEVVGARLTADRFGQEERAYLFDGKQDFIDVKSVILSKNFYDKPSSHAISIWVAIDGSAPDGELVILSDGYGSSCDNKYTIMVEKNGDTLQTSYEYFVTGLLGVGDPGGRASKKVLAKPRPFESGQWLHLVAIYDLERGFMYFYVDGKEGNKISIYLSNGSPIWTRVPNPSSIGVLRGCTALTPAPGLRKYFKGKIDDLRFYNRALSAEEVKALYELEKPKGK